MKYSAYPKYKSSGVEWLGVVPNHWEVKRIGHTTYVKGRIGWQGLTSDEFVDEGPYCVTGTDFYDGKINWASCYHVGEERYLEDPYIQLRDNDLLITKDGTIGKTAVVKKLDGKATLNSGIFLTRPLRHTYDTDYMYWVLNSSSFTAFIDLTKTGTTISHLYQNVFVRFQFPKPPLPEQQAITDFLDHETGRIDSLIGKKQKLIELLKEKRTALISHAVTTGLNPKAKMKPSGVEWLGDVPEHWMLKKGKYIGVLQSTPNVAEEEQSEDEGVIFYIKVDDLNAPENQVYFTKSALYCIKDKTPFVSNALIFPKRGAAIFTNKVSILMNRALLDPNMMGWQIRKSLDIKFYYYSLIARRLDDLADTSTVPQINNKHIYPECFPVPPLPEQQAITAFLDRETHKIDALVVKVETIIEKLKEYRTALISAAVTGKIDVREAV